MDTRELISTFRDRFGEEASLLGEAPGRVNLLGEHVDYNDGLVLPMAIDKAVQFAAKSNSDRTVSLYAPDLGAEVTFGLDALDEKIDLQGQPLPPWALYPAGVAWALQRAGFSLTGMRAVYTSDIPIGAGLSSSAAVEVGFGALWNALCSLDIDPLSLAQLCQKAENEYVGVACGLMDQFASACGEEGYALCFDTHSLEWEAVPLPPGTAIVIADSGVRRSLMESAYNERRRSCEQAVQLLKQYMPDIRSLRDVSPTEFAAYGSALPATIQRRAEHVIKEIGRVKSAVSALKRQDVHAFGALMYSGHASLRDLYEVSTPELDTLVEIARSTPGVYGARLTGAGFGGCTVNLVGQDQGQTAAERIASEYHACTERMAQTYVCRASAGASVKKL